MTNCPKFAHIIKGRENSFAYVEGLQKLNGTKEHIYKLYHEYDTQPQDVFVKTTIPPVVFELLLARILFETSEIDEHYAIGQEEIAEPILHDLYGVDVIDENVHDEVFNLYYVWEKWCGVANKVMELRVFDNDKLRGILADIIPMEF